MLSVHSSVKELERAEKRNFWFLDTGKWLAYQLPGIKTQTHAPTEGMNGSHWRKASTVALQELRSMGRQSLIGVQLCSHKSSVYQGGKFCLDALHSQQKRMDSPGRKFRAGV